jgi:hypothetical protein
MGEEYGEEAPFQFFCSFLDPGLAENVRRGRRRDLAAFPAEGEMPDPQAGETFAACRLSWSWPEGSARQGLRRLYQDLLAARGRWPALRDFTRREARLLPDAARPALLHLARGPAGGPDAVHVYCNLTAQPQPLPPPPAGAGGWAFSSEAGRYGGGRPPGTPPGQLAAWECVAFGPPGRAPEAGG